VASIRRFDEVSEGDEIGPITRLLSKDEVRAYARACGVYFPRFTDDRARARRDCPA